MSYKNFKQYWDQNGDMLKEEGVSKLAAHKIWCDAVSALSIALVKDKLSK